MKTDATSLSNEKERRRSRLATPAELAKLVVDLVRPQPGEKLLDPACGAGEMLAAAGRNYPGVKLYGWDKDADAIKACKKVASKRHLKNAMCLTNAQKSRARPRNLMCLFASHFLVQ